MPKRKQKTRTVSRRISGAKRTLPVYTAPFFRLWVLLPVVLLFVLLSSAFIPLTSRFATSLGGYVLGDEDENEGKKQELQTETAAGQKVRIKTEDTGKSKTETEQGRLQMKRVPEVSNDEEEEEDLDDLDDAEDETEDELEDDDELEADEVEVATNGAKHTIRQRGITAMTDFPLSVNATTNALIVQTPAGKKTVTTLPNQAVRNLLRKNIIETVYTETKPATPGGKIGSKEQKVELVVFENTLQYKIKGIKKHRVFGFIPVSTNVIVFVSAQSGLPTTQQQSVFASLMDILSP